MYFVSPGLITVFAVIEVGPAERTSADNRKPCSDELLLVTLMTTGRPALPLNLRMLRAGYQTFLPPISSA